MLGTIDRTKKREACTSLFLRPAEWVCQPENTAHSPSRRPPPRRPLPAPALRSNPPVGRLHCELPLSLCSVRTLPIGRLHCAPLTVCAGSRGGFSPQSCFADVPLCDTCKLYVAHGDMVIDHIPAATSLPCAGLLCRTRRQSSPAQGFRARYRDRMCDSHGPSEPCVPQRSASCPGPPGRYGIRACGHQARPALRPAWTM